MVFFPEDVRLLISANFCPYNLLETRLKETVHPKILTIYESSYHLRHMTLILQSNTNHFCIKMPFFGSTRPSSDQEFFSRYGVPISCHNNQPIPILTSMLQALYTWFLSSLITVNILLVKVMTTVDDMTAAPYHLRRRYMTFAWKD